MILLFITKILQKLAAIALESGMPGYEVTRGQGRSLNRLIYWEENGYRYGVGALDALGQRQSF